MQMLTFLQVRILILLLISIQKFVCVLKLQCTTNLNFIFAIAVLLIRIIFLTKNFPSLSKTLQEKFIENSNDIE